MEEPKEDIIRAYLEKAATSGSVAAEAINDAINAGVSRREFDVWIAGRPLTCCSEALQNHIKAADPLYYDIEMNRPKWKQDVYISICMLNQGTRKDFSKDTKLPSYFVVLALISLVKQGIVDINNGIYSLLNQASIATMISFGNEGFL